MWDNRDCSDFFALMRHIPDIDAAYAVEAIGGSKTLYNMMLSQFIRLLPSHIDNMDRSFHTDEWDDFAVTAHGIKGSLRQIGNLDLASLGEYLEMAAKTGDSDYCRRRYQSFRSRLLTFLAQLNAVYKNTDEEANAAVSRRSGDIRAFADTLAQAKAALEDYDSLLAMEILSPLTNLRFGNTIDDLLAKTGEALASFQPQKALENVIQIVNCCNCPVSQV